MLTIERTAICIASFRRPQQLEALLNSIARQLPGLVKPIVIVVDNDPEGSGEETVRASGMPILYLQEKRPGIAAARNAALDNLPSGVEAVVFIDDDEIAAPDWLAALIAFANAMQADIVSGPVVSDLPANTPRWIVRGRFIQRETPKTGRHRFLPATNNTLVRAELLPEGVRFSEAFSLTGGSDTELFHRLRRGGASIYWCADAIVFESVPPERATLQWVWRRGIRSGNVLARIQLLERSKFRVLIGGVARFVLGVLKVTAAAVRGEGLQYRDAIYIMRGVGFVGACTGRILEEYRR